MTGEPVPETPPEDPLEGRIYRSHPSIIVDDVISGLFIGFFILLIARVARDTLVMGILGFGALWGIIGAVIWWKTLYEFRPNEMLRTRDALFKSEKRIQYSRLASVEVRRTVVNRIFGTSTLMFNVNSGVNATVSEATLVLRQDEADALRDRLSSMIFHKEVTVEEDREIETLIEVSNADIVVHAILAQPTYQAVFGLAMLIYAVISLFTDNSGGLITAAVLFVFSEAWPFIVVILKYGNYRLYRVGDTVTVESGLIATSRRSFRTNKVNSVRIREPLFARMLGKATLDAEVVGLNGNEGVPILCPLKPRAQVEDLMDTLVPELVFEPEPEHQPVRALYPMLAYAALVSVVSIALGVAFYCNVGTRTDLNQFAQTICLIVEAVLIAGFPAFLFVGVALQQRNRTFDMGTESFMLVTGAYDRSTEFICYDKVQIANVREGLVQRRFGLGTLQVHTLSSMGFRSVTSGIFPPEDLRPVQDEVMARILDGRYDYRRYLR